MKKGIAVVLSIALVLTSVAVPTRSANADVSKGVVKNNDFVVKKVSNPSKGAGKIDGLVPGGDLQNSYAWCMTERGNKLYIGTIKGLGSSMYRKVVSAFLNYGITEEAAFSLADTITNSEFSHELAQTGGQLISYDIETGEMKVLQTAPKGTSYRMAITYNGDVYIGSSSNSENHVYRIDAQDNMEEVYSTEYGTSMRAACEHDGNLYFGGVDSTEELTEEYEDAVKLAILKMDKNNPSKWDRVADFKDFDVEYATDEGVKNPIASPIWDIVSYGGYIYATLPYSKGFIVYKGHPAANGERANEYGWYWEEVVGFNNGINNVGLAPDVEGYVDVDDCLVSSTATPFVFKNKLYLMDFDNTLESMLNTVNNITMPFFVKKGEMFKTMYTTLTHQQNLWVLNNETGKFEVVKNFAKLMKGTCNEYLWRTAEYDGELYITTMDSSVIYRYLTQYVDLGLDKNNLQDKAKIIMNIANLMELFGLNESENETVRNVAKIVIAIGNLVKKAAGNLDPEDFEALSKRYQELTKQFAAKIAEFVKSLQNLKVAENIAEDIAEGKGKQNDTVQLLTALSGKNDLNKTIDSLKEDEGGETTVAPEETTVEETTVEETTAEETTAQQTTAAATEELTTAAETKAGCGIDYEHIKEIIKQIVESIVSMAKTAKSYIDELVQSAIQVIKETDWESIYMYTYIANMVNKETQGFDMYKTSDGVNFTTVTKNGFGDRYNYGGRTLQATEAGLFIGTANPFNGAQLFMLTNKKAEPKTTAPVIVPTTKSKVVPVPPATTKKAAKKKTAKKTTKKKTKKAAAKKITVKKKKTVKVVFKTGKSKKKKKVKIYRGKKARKFAKISKIATIKKVKIKNGKIIVTIKAKKKGKANLKVKISKKKKATRKIVVK